jgi:hypothetical protein
MILCGLAVAGCAKYELLEVHPPPADIERLQTLVVESGEILRLEGVSIQHGRIMLEHDLYLIERCSEGTTGANRSLPCWPGRALADRRLLKQIVNRMPPHRIFGSLERAASSLDHLAPGHNRVIIGTKPVAVALVDAQAVPVRPGDIWPQARTAAGDFLELPAAGLLVFPEGVLDSAGTADQATLVWLEDVVSVRRLIELYAAGAIGG